MSINMPFINRGFALIEYQNSSPSPPGQEQTSTLLPFAMVPTVTDSYAPSAKPINLCRAKILNLGSMNSAENGGLYVDDDVLVFSTNTPGAFGGLKRGIHIRDGTVFLIPLQDIACRFDPETNHPVGLIGEITILQTQSDGSLKLNNSQSKTDKDEIVSLSEISFSSGGVTDNQILVGRILDVPKWMNIEYRLNSGPVDREESEPVFIDDSLVDKIGVVLTNKTIAMPNSYGGFFPWPRSWVRYGEPRLITIMSTITGDKYTIAGRELFAGILDGVKGSTDKGKE